MKPIKVNEKNAARIQVVLDELQKRCTKRTVTADQVIELSKRYAGRLELHKKDLHLFTLKADPLATAYYRMGQPESTQWEITFNKKGDIFVSHFKRDYLDKAKTCRVKHSNDEELVKARNEAILDYFYRQY